MFSGDLCEQLSQRLTQTQELHLVPNHTNEFGGKAWGPELISKTQKVGAEEATASEYEQLSSAESFGPIGLVCFYKTAETDRRIKTEKYRKNK